MQDKPATKAHSPKANQKLCNQNSYVMRTPDLGYVCVLRQLQQAELSAELLSISIALFNHSQAWWAREGAGLGWASKFAGVPFLSLRNIEAGGRTST
jgi:hypothetical protein